MHPLRTSRGRSGGGEEPGAGGRRGTLDEGDGERKARDTSKGDGGGMAEQDLLMVMMLELVSLSLSNIYTSSQREGASDERTNLTFARSFSSSNDSDGSPEGQVRRTIRLASTQAHLPQQQQQDQDGLLTFNKLTTSPPLQPPPPQLLKLQRLRPARRHTPIPSSPSLTPPLIENTILQTLNLSLKVSLSPFLLPPPL